MRVRLVRPNISSFNFLRFKLYRVIIYIYYKNYFDRYLIISEIWNLSRCASKKSNKQLYFRDSGLIFTFVRRAFRAPYTMRVAIELGAFDWFKTAVIGVPKRLAVTCRRYFHVYVRRTLTSFPGFSSSYIYLRRAFSLLSRY